MLHIISDSLNSKECSYRPTSEYVEPDSTMCIHVCSEVNMITQLLTLTQAEVTHILSLGASVCPSCVLLLITIFCCIR